MGYVIGSDKPGRHREHQQGTDQSELLGLG